MMQMKNEGWSNERFGIRASQVATKEMIIERRMRALVMSGLGSELRYQPAKQQSQK